MNAREALSLLGPGLTIPTHALDCECDMCEDMPRFSARAESAACKAARISPLARAALDNGIDFESVEMYVLSRMTEAERNQVLAGNLYGAMFQADDQQALDAALARSFLAQLDGSVAAARLWWQGALP